MYRPASKSILEGRKVVHIERYHQIGAHGLEELCQIARRHRIARLGLPALARIGQIENDGNYLRRSVFPARGNEEEQLAKLVIGRPLPITVQRMDDEDVLATHVDKGACLACWPSS